ncbi:MAG: septal ring lytic transglycosylase RlpA family protein [Alphaproteobacteria bacterium]
MISKKAFSITLMSLIATTFIVSCSSNITGIRNSGYRYGNNGGATYKVGSPYKINGTWYYPKEDYTYSEVGVASWYGPQFHNKLTANNEIYDMNALTAAHRTLPLPSMVKVTNLQNGRSLVLKVNDRGPFAKDRIIDISKRGAQLLGFIEQGTAKVRVEVLPEESLALKNQLLSSEGRSNLGSMAGGIVPVAQNSVSEIPVRANELPDAEKEDYLTSKTSSQNISADQYDIWQEPVKNNSALTPEVTKSDFTLESTSPSAVSGTMVQVGAFSSYENAQKLSNSISSIGNASISDIDVNGQKFYRVRITAPNSDDAKNIVSKLINSGHQGARIVNE